MSIREIKVQNLSAFQDLKFYPLIAKFQKGVLRVSMLPIPVVLIDQQTNLKLNWELKTVIQFREFFPELVCYMFAQKCDYTFELAEMKKHNVKNVEDLALYIYAPRS